MFSKSFSCTFLQRLHHTMSASASGRNYIKGDKFHLIHQEPHKDFITGDSKKNGLSDKDIFCDVLY